MNGIWGFLSGKLGIQLSELNKETVKTALENKGLASGLITELLDFLNRCEFAQFAPGSGGENLQSVYDEAAALIDNLNGKF